jgi:hypothetical protein
MNQHRRIDDILWAQCGLQHASQFTSDVLAEKTFGFSFLLTQGEFGNIAE